MIESGLFFARFSYNLKKAIKTLTLHKKNYNPISIYLSGQCPRRLLANSS
ncbi:hypothetical protein CCP2SC5_830010 [Azospirillaceae bacterium]